MMKIKCPSILLISTDNALAPKLFYQLLLFILSVAYHPVRGAFSTTKSPLRPKKMFCLTVYFANLNHTNSITLGVKYRLYSNILLRG